MAMKTINAKTGAYGYAYGPAYIIDSINSVDRRIVSDIESELMKLKDAVDNVGKRLACAKETADENSIAIIEAQIAMLCDDSYLGRIRTAINEDAYCAEYAVYAAGKKCADEFEAMDNAYLNARGADIRGISLRLIKELTGVNNEIIIDKPSVVFAEELTPEMVSTIDKDNIKAFVSTKGTKTSHVAILCGNYSIPYLFGVDYHAEGVVCDTMVAVDASEAKLYVEPDEDTVHNMEKAADLRKSRSDAETDTGKIMICANIGGADEVANALACGADGIGLFRTEFLYMGDKLPTEEEQFAVYKTVVDAMDGRDVIIRTMDIGADKQSSCMNLVHEDNPALGKRAIRICLEDKELFKTQLRAILRASCYGNVKMMYPMITSVRELEEIEKLLEEVSTELTTSGINYAMPSVGVMIETPSAAVLSDKLAKKVDFFSIGTNDLTQYTLAVDRMSDELDDYYDVHSEAVMRLIELVVKNAHAADVTVGVCGELGGDEWAIPRLIELGIDELSMAPSKIKNAKAVVTEVLAEKARKDKVKMGMEIMCAPVDGEKVEMCQIPDPAFSTGMLGKCMGVIPNSGDIYAPCDGKVYMIAQTKHAIGIMSDYGNDVLVHVGIDTVTLGGKGFTVLVSEGEQVTKGTLMMQVDLEVIKKAGLSDMVITVVKEEKADEPES